MPRTKLSQPHLDEPRTLQLQGSYKIVVYFKLQKKKKELAVSS